MSEGNVSADAIGASAPEIKGSAGPTGPDPFTKNAMLEQHLGMVGRFVGGGPEKAGNIALIVVLFALCILLVAGAGMAYAQSDKLYAGFTALAGGSISLATGALGYVFGKGSSN